MIQKKLVLPIATAIAAASIAWTPSNSLASTFKKSGVGVEVTILNGLFSKVTPGEISGRYKAGESVEGILFHAPLSGPEPLGGSDIEYFHFLDTKGNERCYGAMSMSSGGINIWEVKGSVPGYRCSTVGKNYRFNFGN